MTKLSKYTLSLLSLVVIVGFAVDSFTYKTDFVFIGFFMIAIGAFAFGTLLHKEKHG